MNLLAAWLRWCLPPRGTARQHRMWAGRLLLVIGLLPGPAALAAAPAALVVVVAEDDREAYREAFEALRDRLQQGSAREWHFQRIDARPGTDVASAIPRDAGVVVTLGGVAAQAVQGTPHPAVHLLLSRLAYQALGCDAPDTREHRRCTGVFSDPPLARQAELIRAAMPRRHRVAVLGAPQDRALREELDHLPPALALATTLQAAADATLYATLESLSGAADVLLVTPEAPGAGASHAREILTSAYRHQIPVVAYSAAYARAGATLALYPVPRQLGEQAAELVAAAIEAPASLPPAQPPRHLHVAVNRSVARSLALVIPDDGALLAALHEEAAP